MKAWRRWDGGGGEVGWEMMSPCLETLFWSSLLFFITMGTKHVACLMYYTYNPQYTVPWIDSYVPTNINSPLDISEMPKRETSQVPVLFVKRCCQKKKVWGAVIVVEWTWTSFLVNTVPVFLIKLVDLTASEHVHVCTLTLIITYVCALLYMALMGFQEVTSVLRVLITIAWREVQYLDVLEPMVLTLGSFTLLGCHLKISTSEGNDGLDALLYYFHFVFWVSQICPELLSCLSSVLAQTCSASRRLFGHACPFQLLCNCLLKIVFFFLIITKMTQTPLK